MKEGKVEIQTDTVALSSTKRVKKMLTRDLECTLLYLIVGGGNYLRVWGLRRPLLGA